MSRQTRLLFLAGCLLLAAAIAAQHLLAGPLHDTVQGLLYGLAAGVLFAAVLRSRQSEGCDTGTPGLRRRYLRELLPAMALYMLALFGSIFLLRHVEAAWLRALVALLPVPPIAMALRAIVHYIRDTDELQRQIELEAVSMATALVSLVYLAAGFLQSAKVIDIDAAPAMIWMFPALCVVYGVIKTVIQRRYR